MTEKIYTCEWHNEEKTIVVVTSLISDWTWDDAKEAIEAQVALTETVEHPVHVVLYFKERPNIPVTGAFQHLQKLMKLQAKNEDLSIFININRTLTTLLNTIGKIYKLRDLVAQYRFVSTMEEALEEIANYEAAKNRDKAS